MVSKTEKGVQVDCVILQRERVTFLDARQNPVDGYRVTFQLPDGTVDWVDLPKSMYTKAKVTKAITAAVKRHSDVLS